MPDISMCMNNTCPSNRSCYRYTAKPNPYRQAYAHFTFDPATGYCEEFILGTLTPRKPEGKCS
jgi:hypothetical protein